MSMGEEIAAKLEDLGLGLYSAEPRTLFVDEMPDDPPVCAAVFETGGPAPDGGFGEPGIRHENATCSIQARGEPGDSGEPHVRIRQMYLELAKIQAELLGSTFYLEVTPLQAPFILKRDEKQRVVWAFNLLAKKDPS